MIDAFADKMYKDHGSRMFFAADEFYLKSGRPIPTSSYYEEYPQLENGVGMLRSFSDDASAAIEDISKKKKAISISVATGVAAYPQMCDIAARVCASVRKMSIKVYKIKNEFFGESITVSGLLTGKDIYEQLKGKDLGDVLLVPPNALRHGEDVFLCGMSVKELSELLGVRVKAACADGYEWIEDLFDL
jgi:NifB/MoaA-like Fe-S oxidoreductase